MAYQIDFTASNYASRARRKIFLRLFLLAAVGGAAYGVYDVYHAYNQPTLNMRLAKYEAVAHPIEEMNAAWDDVAKEFGTMMRYYRLFWAANPTNFLNAMASADAPHLIRGFQPESWTLKTGGECTLKYRYKFNPDDKAKQAKRLETNLVHAVTAIVEVATNVPFSVQGVQLENLLNVFLHLRSALSRGCLVKLAVTKEESRNTVMGELGYDIRSCLLINLEDLNLCIVCITILKL